MKPQIILFAKCPQPGQVKTRLIPALGAQGAATLAQRMLIHTLGEALQAGLGGVELCVSPAPSDPAWQSVIPPALCDGVRWQDQGEGDLGERLARAAARLSAAAQGMLFIGSDCPALNADILRQAAAQLDTHDAVLIPSTDGGYVLLGLRHGHASLFTDIAWSTARVAETTRERLRALGWHWAELPALRDVDEPADLTCLPPNWPAVPFSPPAAEMRPVARG